MIVLVMVAEAVFMIAGFIFGQIRTLQRLGWLANIAVWVRWILHPSWTPRIHKINLPPRRR